MNYLCVCMIFVKCDFFFMYESLVLFYDFNIINYCCLYVKLYFFGFYVGVRVMSNVKIYYLCFILSVCVCNGCRYIYEL